MDNELNKKDNNHQGRNVIKELVEVTNEISLICEDLESQFAKYNQLIDKKEKFITGVKENVSSTYRSIFDDNKEMFSKEDVLKMIESFFRII